LSETVRALITPFSFERAFPQPLCCITRPKLEAEVRAWRERFPALYYRSMDDCIDRREP
jgi:hypothetical protein